MPSVHDLTHQAGFVFEGTVEQVGASTSSAYPAAAETAVVKVTRLLKTTSALAGYEGQRVTVHLQAPVTLKVGQAATFFTHGIHYGEGLVVTELGTLQQPASMTGPELTAALQFSADTEMTQRLAEADLVVTGVASAPRRQAPSPTLATSVPVRRVSEHAPDWWVATVTVDSVEKGIHHEKTMDVMFANSTDIAWARAPKIKGGERGVWLLHTQDRYGRPVSGHAITDPLDFRPAEDVARVRALVK
jgi:hypothetical protein